MLTKLALVLIVAAQVVWSDEKSTKRCARATPACLLTPQGTEGPYHWNATMRQDITEGKPGIPLRITMTVMNTKTCSPIPDAVVDLWQCDTIGIYSHFVGASLGQMNAKPDNTSFFRGQQVTNRNGVVHFDTTYPGWYLGRATHIHVKVHIGATLTPYDGAIYAKGGHVSHTGQFYFDDYLTDKVATVFPYSTHNIRRTRNNEDGIYNQESGASLIVPIQFLTNELQGGMKTEITLAIDPTAIPLPLNNFP